LGIKIKNILKEFFYGAKLYDIKYNFYNWRGRWRNRRWRRIRNNYAFFENLVIVITEDPGLIN